MPVQSSFNVVVPLAGDGPARHCALFNTLAGSMDVVETEVVHALDAYGPPPSKLGGEYGEHRLPPPRIRPRRDGPAAPLAPEVLSYLDRRGYLFASEAEERAQSRLLYDVMIDFHRRAVRQPLVVVPTYRCNLHCRYCWQRLYHMDSPVMSSDVAERLFASLPRFLDERTSGGERDLVVFGGEPLQDVPEVRERVLQLASLGKHVGLSVKIITNGVALAGAVPHLRGKVDLLQVTVDGVGAIHAQRRPLLGPGGERGDSFTPMVEGVTRALKSGIRVNLRVNVDEENLPALPALAEFMEGEGWLRSGRLKPYLTPLKNHDRQKRTCPETALLRDVKDLCARDARMRIYDLSGFAGLKYFDGVKETGLFSLHRFFNCEAQINLFVFDARGDVYACWDAAGIREHAVGTFYPAIRIDEEKLAQWRRRTSLDVGACRGCSSSPHCGGGCQFLAFERHGSFTAPSCNGMMEGYIASIVENSEWLLERARAGDHVIGLVHPDRVMTAIDRPFGLLAADAGAAGALLGCS